MARHSVRVSPNVHKVVHTNHCTMIDISAIRHSVCKHSTKEVYSRIFKTSARPPRKFRGSRGMFLRVLNHFDHISGS